MRKTALVVILIAVLLGGTATAASRWIITSSQQIKPSVLSQLHGKLATRTVVGPVQTMFPIGFAGQPVTATASCPAGTTVVGGGWDQGPVPATSEDVSNSEPGGSGWEVLAVNTGDTTATISAVAVCATLK